MTDDEALEFAVNWLAAWNAHDLDRIMDHYAADIELTSPFVARLTSDASGTLRGKDKVRAYFDRGLKAYPDLRFELTRVYAGVSSVVLEYVSVGGLQSAEMMELDWTGSVSRVRAHYMAG